MELQDNNNRNIVIIIIYYLKIDVAWYCAYIYMCEMVNRNYSITDRSTVIPVGFV